jgi:putative zinc finger/helix-turn-helix YgiT family protein
MNCPNDHGPMKRVKAKKKITFRGRRIEFKAEHFVCEQCGLEADDVSLATANQKRISDAYRSAVSLLTGAEIVEGRKKRRWSQEELARAMNVGIASVKRWETGQIQTRPMDDILRRVFSGEKAIGNPCTGNRPLSLPRAKLVLEEFSKRLGRKLLKPTKEDRLLYAAKYLFYADMMAFRETGRSMTGGTYAALPLGPQLNNYRELVDSIRQAKDTEAEALTDHEMRIITRIAMAFPDNQSILRASHDEEIYKSKNPGELIPYIDAKHLKAM